MRTDVDLHARTVAGRELTLSVSAAPLDGRREGRRGHSHLARRHPSSARWPTSCAQTKEFLERLIDSSVDAIIAADMKGNIILFNKAAEAIYGWYAARTSSASCT